MSCTSNYETSFLMGQMPAEDEAKWLSSITNLEQIRESLVLGVPRRTMHQTESSSRDAKTIVCEDREQRLALLDKDSKSSRSDSESINEILQYDNSRD